MWLYLNEKNGGKRLWGMLTGVRFGAGYVKDVGEVRIYVYY
jgi:hypothetical protein